MLLAIDVGNSNAKFALFDDKTLVARWSLATDTRRTADEYMVWLDHLLAIDGHERRRVSAVAIATVVPRALDALLALSEKYFSLKAGVAGHGAMDWNISLLRNAPHSLGADRAVNAIAAQTLAPGQDKLVVSCGTATTLCHIGKDGSYRGGSIASGVNLSLETLVAAGAKLPRIAIGVPEDDSVIGRTTESQMLIGIYWGHVCMIEGLVMRMKREIGRDVVVIATGGLAPLFWGRIPAFDRIEPDLTLNGLAILSAQSEAKPRTQSGALDTSSASSASGTSSASGAPGA